MPKKLLQTILLFFTIFVLSKQTVFAEELIIEVNDPPFINEIYPAPNTEEEEFIEIYFEGEITDFFDKYTILNHKFTKPPFSLEISKIENLLVIPTGTSYLRNTSGAVFIIQNEDNQIIDSICYGNPLEVDINDCVKNIESAPVKGRSLSYFPEAENFLVTEPSSGRQNIFVDIDFDIRDEESNLAEKFKIGEGIFIKDKSEIYGIKDFEIEWLLDDTEITDLEIETTDLSTGTHFVKARFLEYEETKQFEIFENFDGLKISEIFPNPSGEDETGVNEWIEIYNSSNRTINISGLTIQRVTNTQRYKYIYTQDTNLKPRQYVLIYPNFSITNSNCALELLDPSEKILDKFNYEFQVENDEGVIKFNDKVVITATPTPGKPNEFTPRIEEIISENEMEAEELFENNSDFTGLIITEIFPNPVGEDISGENEWIEIFNSSTRTINLRNLVIQKETSRKYLFIFNQEAELKPGEYFVLYPTFSLNNSSAKFEIQNEAGRIFDHVEYDLSVKEGSSLVRIENTTVLKITNSPTPGTENIQNILAAETSAPIPVQEIRKLPEDTEIIIEGSVTVEPNLLGSNIFYIQDEGGGVQIYTDGDEELILGEIVRIHGEIDNFHSEPRVRVLENTITKIGQSNPITSIYSNIGGINPDVDVGRLVTIEGTIMKTSGDTFYVNDGTGEIKVSIKDTTGIERPECKKGYYAKITGILSVWDQDKEGNLNLRLLPRYQEDVLISKTLAETGGNNWVIFISGVMLVFSGKYILTEKN